jgi:hypothetical protein
MAVGNIMNNFKKVREHQTFSDATQWLRGHSKDM